MAQITPEGVVIEATDTLIGCSEDGSCAYTETTSQQIFGVDGTKQPITSQQELEQLLQEIGYKQKREEISPSRSKEASVKSNGRVDPDLHKLTVSTSRLQQPQLADMGKDWPFHHEESTVQLAVPELNVWD